MATIFAFTFLAVFLLTLAVLTIPLASRIRVRQSLDNLSAYEVADDRPGDQTGFADRLLWPALDRVGALAKRWTDQGRIDKTRQKLILAGVRNLSAEKFASVKLALGAAGLVLYLAVILPWLVMSGWRLWLGLPLVALAYFLPDIWLERRIERRQKQIGVALADAIDILTIAIEAGLAFDSALAKVAKNTDGPLSEEFGRMLGELQIGIARREALRNLSERSTVSELQSFCSTIIQADNLGVSISKILKTKAAELRTRRHQRAEESAMKTPVKLVFPIVLCILPALLIVILGPAVIRIGGALFKVF